MKKQKTKLNILLHFIMCLFVINLTLDINLFAQDNKNVITLSDKQNDISFKNVWARDTIAGTNNSAIYMKIINKTSKDYYLTKAENYDLANNIELHQSYIDEKGIARMVSIKQILIPANTELELKPGGIHIMLLGLMKSLNKNDEFDITLTLHNDVNILEATVPVIVK